MIRPARLSFLACFAITMYAQGPEFEVASVRPSPPATQELVQSGRTRMGMKIDAGRIDIVFMPMQALLSYAFGMPQNQLSIPDWAMAEHFDIQAKLPAGASEDQIPVMLQALLADRFKMAAHRQSKTETVYALIVGKGTLKAKRVEDGAATPPADPNAPPEIAMPVGGTQTRMSEDPQKGVGTASNPRLGTVRVQEAQNSLRLEAANTTFQGLAGLLTELVRQPVIDMTGLAGRFQLVLELTMSEALETGPGGAPSVAGDPRLGPVMLGLEQIGLKLESRKMPVETVVIDHLEKTPSEN